LPVEQLTLITPTFLFSAISLLLLAYTNRFFALAALIRGLKPKYHSDGNPAYIAQIKNLRT
jgi:hypothetical protein